MIREREMESESLHRCLPDSLHLNQTQGRDVAPTSHDDERGVVARKAVERKEDEEREETGGRESRKK
jgi:hypothetical protein